MVDAADPRVSELCARIAKERDPHKVLELTRQLNSLLEGKNPESGSGSEAHEPAS